MRAFGKSFPGFTLIELLVVVLILGVLAAVIVPNVVGRGDDAKMGAAKQDVATLMQALKLYRLDNGRYPSNDQGLGALTTKPTTEPLPANWKTGGYIEKLPKDPWGNAYVFANPGVHGEVDVMSYGRDGKPGGTGPDADVHNGNL
jgi:general secretion pathway protein G